MTKAKYHDAYYVAIQEQTGIYRIKLMIGPFDTHRAAMAMTGPMRKSIGRRPWNVMVHNYKLPVAKKLPAGAWDLSRLDPSGVIAASRNYR